MNSPQLIEIASWRIATELVRQFPKALRICETHPGGGQYDCLTILHGKLGHLADFNRVGRLHVFKRADGQRRLPEPWEIWRDMASSHEMKEILLRVDDMLGLKKPKSLPATTPRSLTYRFIAAFLSHAAFSHHRWECRSGMADTSGYGGGPKGGLFAKFPGAISRLEVREESDPLGEPSYRFWFLMMNEKPRLLLEDTGRAWQLGKKQTIQLMPLYAKNHRVWPLFSKVAGDLLP